MGKLQFLVDNGFKSTSISFAAIDSPERLDQIAGFLAEHDLSLSIHPREYRALEEDFDAVKRGVDEFCTKLEQMKDPLRLKIATFGVGPFHRFMDEPSLEKQMDLMVRNLQDVAARCKELGCPLGIENHGDYYCSDLVELCQRVPGLGIFLDTGNCFLIGEKPVPGCREAAPYTIGTHFKDHRVHPEPRDGLKFVIEGAALGFGHCGLREIYMDLIELAPDPQNLMMQWELIPQKSPPLTDMELVAKSWEFIRSLPEPEAK